MYYVYNISKTAPVISWIIQYNDNKKLETKFKDLPYTMKYGNGTESCRLLLYDKKKGQIKNRMFWLKEYDLDKATKIAEKYYKNKPHQVTLNELLI